MFLTSPYIDQAISTQIPRQGEDECNRDLTPTNRVCCGVLARGPIRRHVKAGLITIAVGILPLLYTFYRVHSHNWRPLSVPVVLTPRDFESPEFTTDLTGTYIVSLVFSPVADDDKEDCQIGEEIVKGTCQDIPRTLYLEWSVLAGGGTVVPASPYEPHAFSGSPGEVGTEVGRFDAKRGNRQRIRLRILNDAGELNADHPKLIVEAHRIYWEQWIILGQLAFLFAIFFATVGLGLILVPLLFRRTKLPVA